MEISVNYRATYSKKYIIAWDKRDGHIIRYLLNHGFYKASIIRTCKNCGDANSPTHVTNICPKFDKLRNMAWKELNELRMTRVNEGKIQGGGLDIAFLKA